MKARETHRHSRDSPARLCRAGKRDESRVRHCAGTGE